MPTCNTCAHFRPVKPRKTSLQRYEEDSRPESPKGFWGGLRWSWDPQKWRADPPSAWHLELDAAIVEDNAMGGWCSRFPKTEYVRRDYGCGEHTRRAS
jgi:hypothetical protein